MAANIPEGQVQAQFEFQKMQLMNSLSNVAEQMRNCAAIADQFAQLVSHVPYAAGMSLGQFAVPAAGPQTGRKRKGRNGEDGEGKRARVVRKPKDPNAPKRPASSYLLFQNEVRAELKAKNPDTPNNVLLGMIAKMWNEMSADDKEQYELRQKAAKDQYLAQKAVYETRGSPDAAVVAPVIQPVVAPAPKPKPAPAPAPVASSEEETSEEEQEQEQERDDQEEGSSSEESSEEEQPPPKKSKKEVPAKPDQVPVKEKRQRKKL